MIEYIDIPGGMKTAAFAMGKNAIENIAGFLEENFPGRKAWIIADGNTWRAAGEKAAKYLPDSYPQHSHIDTLSTPSKQVPLGSRRT